MPSTEHHLPTIKLHPPTSRLHPPATKLHPPTSKLHLPPATKHHAPACHQMAVQQSRLEHYEVCVERLRCVDVPFYHVPLSVRRKLEQHLEPESVYASRLCWRDVAEQLGFNGDEVQVGHALYGVLSHAL